MCPNSCQIGLNRAPRQENTPGPGLEVCAHDEAKENNPGLGAARGTSWPNGLSVDHPWPSMTPI